MAKPVSSGSLVGPHPVVPLLIDPVTATVQAPPGQPVGALVVAEVQAAGVVYTVPSGKTFYGAISLMVGGAVVGTVSVTDASSVVWAKASGAGSAAIVPSIVQVTIAGASGNALTVAVAGGATLVSAMVAGYVK